MFSMLRTKVECAGLCLSLPNCFAFQWLTLDKVKAQYSCLLLKEGGMCKGKESSVEIYADGAGRIPFCPGILFEIN